MIESIPFWKVESIGNDFVLVHLSDVEALRGEASQDDFLRDLAIVASERRFGIGSDGLLAVGPGVEGVVLDRMFNPDGTEDFCGNGLRCVAIHAQAQGWVGDRFVIRHLGQDVPTRILGNTIENTLPAASYDPARIPVEFKGSPMKTFQRMPIWSGLGISVGGSALTTGSTHVVILGKSPVIDDELFFLASPEIENDPQFPDRTSVIWAEEAGSKRLRIRIWERGAGETLGCGTGSAAAAVELMRAHGISGRIEVVNPGGTVWVAADAWDAALTITGPAHEVYEGSLPLASKGA